MRTLSVTLLTVAASFIFLSGCAAGQATPPPLSPPVIDRENIRWSTRPLPVGESFRAAVEAGTRTLSGEPGPRYWTQRVDYAIEAELEPSTAVVTGREKVTYHNRSPNPIGFLIFHLYQNLFTPEVQRSRSVPVTGGISIEGVEIRGVAVPEAARPSRNAYFIDETLMGVYFNEALAPGDSIDLNLTWSFEVPPAGAPRQGHIDHELYNVAQWYPQVAVYDDLRGWNATPYLGTGEFYLEYGNFDVSLTLPEGWLVGATGTLENPEEVLTEGARSRLSQALAGDEVAHVVTADDHTGGTATQRAEGGKLTWEFSADGVRDFAFAASNRYLWDATHATGPDTDGDGVPETIAVHSFYRPEALSWANSADFIRHAVAFHAERWHPYPWPQMTGAEGPVPGMEYPMLTFVADFGDPRPVYETLNHEIGHMWYPMMIGTNEAAFAWMDEGLTTYIEGYATADRFSEPDYWRGDMEGYLSVAGAEFETPMMRAADLHGPDGTYSYASYWKPATMLRVLEALVGQDVVWEALRSYTRNWLYRHPDPLDFFNTVEAAAGEDLDWFWHPFWYETAAMDQAVESVSTTVDSDGREVVRVVVADLGDAPLPAIVEVALTGGETVRGTIPVEVWLQGVRRHTLDLALPTGAVVAGVVVDPERLFPDVDRENNNWTPEGD